MDTLNCFARASCINGIFRTISRACAHIPWYSMQFHEGILQLGYSGMQKPQHGRLILLVEPPCYVAIWKELYRWLAMPTSIRGSSARSLALFSFIFPQPYSLGDTLARFYWRSSEQHSLSCWLTFMTPDDIFSIYSSEGAAPL